jgi:arginase
MGGVDLLVTKRELALIGAASGWGAGFRQTENGPPALRDLGLARWLREAGIAAQWTAMVEPSRFWREHPELERTHVFEEVAELNGALCRAVCEAMESGRFPVVIGGDHSIAMGTWGGVARGLARQPFGLLWFDAHLDAHTIATTPSMNPHGMPAAVLLGHGEPDFLAVGGGALRPEHLCYIGARSFEPAEHALLEGLGVRIFYMDEVHRRGLGNVVDEALALATDGTAGFGLSIDLDGFDPADAPGIGLKEPNGLRRGEMLEALGEIAPRPDLRALEIVEYIPEFDEGMRTAHLVRDLLSAALVPAAATADTHA